MFLPGLSHAGAGGFSDGQQRPDRACQRRRIARPFIDRRETGFPRRRRFNGAGSLFIDPGAPWQNAWIESFNSRLRDELLNLWQFDSLLEAATLVAKGKGDKARKG